MNALARVLRACGRWRERLIQQGPAALLWAILADCLTPLGLVRLVSLYERDLNQPIPPIESHLDNLITIGSESDADSIAAQVAHDSRVAEDERRVTSCKVRLRFRVGQVCFLAKINSSIVHYAWMARHQSPSVMDRFIVLQDDEAYLSWAHTAKEWRGMGLYPAVISRMMRFLQERGYQRIYAFVHAENRSSRNGLERIGWNNCGTLLCFQPRWMERAWIWRLGGGSQTDKFIVRPTADMLEKFLPENQRPIGSAERAVPGVSMAQHPKPQAWRPHSQT